MILHKNFMTLWTQIVNCLIGFWKILRKLLKPDIIFQVNKIPIFGFLDPIYDFQRSTALIGKKLN